MIKKLIAFVVFAIFLLTALPAYAEGPVVLVGAMTEPKDISPGDNFDLKLKVKNDGGSKANNLIATLDVNSISISTASNPSQEQKNTSPQTPISVIGESNVRYLGTVAAGGEKEAIFRMVADGTAGSGTYNINVKLDYDGARAQNQVIGIVIIRRADLRITQMSVPGTVKTGKEFKLAADVVNGGNYPINSVSAEISGDVTSAKIKSPDYFIGTLEVADSDTYETKVKFFKSGEKTLKLKVNYIDDFNHQHSIVKDLKIKVEGDAKAPASGKKSDGFLSRLINFFKALLGLGGNQE